MDSGKNKQKRGKMQEKKTVNSLLTDTHSFGKLYECELTQLNMWRLSQVVRHGSATPLSPVRFRSSPLRKNHEYVVLFILSKSGKDRERHIS